MLYPVILTGGSGTRLWPLSRSTFPKQLLPLLGDQSTFQQTLLRLDGLHELASPLVVCSHDHRFLIAEQLREIDVTPQSLMLEPAGRNTAPAIAAAALHLLEVNPNAMMLVVPSDHVISDVPAFHKAIEHACEVAKNGFLTTFGIVAPTPETGYGYIQRGEMIQEGVYAVSRFAEKPDAATAQSYLDAGDYFWNSGMFLFRADRFLQELETFRPDIVQSCRAALSASYADLDFLRLGEAEFRACPSESIDYAVMEHTQHAAVVPVDIGWNDIGSWSALWDVQQKDECGNVTHGEVRLENVRNSYVHAQSRLIAAVGVEDLIIVETPDAILVASKESSQDVKIIVERLVREGRAEGITHTPCRRP